MQQDTVSRLSQLNYRPELPAEYRPGIAVIGCGGISKYHLQAYRDAGLSVRAVCDLELDRAKQAANDYFPDADAVSDYQQVLDRSDIEVVDITTHPPQRPPIIRAALLASKHVLSQKPFVLDLDEGQELVDLASECKRYLAVNQNGRWAPHFSYARQVASCGIIGTVFAAHLSCHWDHRWVEGTEFENVKHLVLYDYAIHWFDMLRCLLPGKAQRVFASTARVPNQTLMPDLLGQALVEFDSGQATLAFDAALPHGSHERTFLSGTLGSLHSCGTGNQHQELTVNTQQGSWTPTLQGQWFPDGFRGTMGELLCAIEQGRHCLIDAADNLESLALCFAAVHSAETGTPVKPGAIRRLPQ